METGLEQSEIKARLAGIGDLLARVLNPDHTEDRLDIAVIKQSDNAVSVQVTLGDQTGFLKLFQMDDAAGKAFARERKALDLLAGQNIPQLLLVAEAERAILTRFIDGTPFQDVLSQDNLIQSAEHLGQWFGRLSNAAPQQALETTWGAYIAQYETGFDRSVLDQQQAFLNRAKIGISCLSHNDNVLSNFILGRDKRLYAVDFENTRMKPEGWDLITAARAIFGRFPDQLQVASQSLLRGYRLTSKTCTLAEDFDQVINALALAMALSNP